MIHILHHANCADGFAAACIAAEHFNGRPHRITPVNYPDAVQVPPTLEPNDTLIYVDYTPPKSAFIDGPLRRANLWKQEISILCIDHHATAATIHNEHLNPHESVFDATRCGAALTWLHYNPGLPVPQALELIEWRDLGPAFQPEHADDPRTDAALCLHAYLMRCLPRTPQAWHGILHNPSLLPNAIHTGKKMKLTDQCIIAAAISSPYWLDFQGEEIPAINGLEAGLISDGMNALLKAYPTAPFAASWYVDPSTGQTVYSLRSRKGGPDVGAIAKALAGEDGGGHPNAAGFHTRNPIPFV